MRNWDDGWTTALRQLALQFPDRSLVVVGAAALRHALGNRFRTTLDIDVCLEIDVETALDPESFPRSWQRDPSIVHRWQTATGHTVDVIPASHALLEAGVICWPGDVRMSLLGFDLLSADQVELPEIADNVAVAGLRGLFVTKIAAWFDRPADRAKDLADIGQILMSYAEDTERAYTEPAIPADLDFADRAAFLLGLDLFTIASDRHLALVERFVAECSNPNKPGHAAMLEATDEQALRTTAGLRDRLRSVLDGLRTRSAG